LFWGAQAASLQRSAACRTHFFADGGDEHSKFAASCREQQAGSASSLCSSEFAPGMLDTLDYRQGKRCS
jgi:hypothetical protein